MFYYHFYLAATKNISQNISFSYDMMLNLSENHFDTIISLNSRFTLVNVKSGGLGLRRKVNDDLLLESFYYDVIVKNICASQSYHCMNFFETYTYNNKKTVWGGKCEKLD